MRHNEAITVRKKRQPAHGAAVQITHRDGRLSRLLGRDQAIDGDADLGRVADVKSGLAGDVGGGAVGEFGGDDKLLMQRRDATRFALSERPEGGRAWGRSRRRRPLPRQPRRSVPRLRVNRA